MKEKNFNRITHLLIDFSMGEEIKNKNYFIFIDKLKFQKKKIVHIKMVYIYCLNISKCSILEF